MYKHKTRGRPRWKTRAQQLNKEQKTGSVKSLLSGGFSFRAAKALDLPIDIVSETPHLEISGNREMVVEGCRSIITYDDDLVSLDVGKMMVRIIGRDLVLRNFTDHSVIVDGFVLSVEFLT